MENENKNKKTNWKGFILAIGGLFLIMALGYVFASNGITNSDNANYKLMYNGNLYSAYFKNNSMTSQTTLVTSQGYNFSFDIANSQGQWYNSNTRAIMGNPINPANTNITNTSNKIIYNGAWANSNLTYTLSDNQIKEDIIASSIPTNVSVADFFRYRINVYYNNSLQVCVNNICYLHPSSISLNTTNDILFKDNNNQTIFILPSLYITDSNGTTVKGTYYLSLNNGIDLWYLAIPYSFIKNAVYPIDIDPTISFPVASASGAYVINITTEQSNYSHLSINPISPYDSLVGYWSFDKDTSATTYDLTSNNNDGTLTSGAYANSSCVGVYGNCLWLGGSTQYVNIPTSTSMSSLNTSATFNFWINRLPAGNRWGNVLEKSSVMLINTGNSNVGTLSVYIKGNLSNGCSNTTSGVIPTGWNMITVTYNGSGVNNTDMVKLYVNNNLIKYTCTGVTPANIGSATATYLGLSASQGTYWNGTMDEIMLFNSTLTQAQVSDIYTNQSQRFYPQGQIYLGNNILSQPSNNTINLSLDDYAKIMGTDINVSIGYWNIGYGYNNTDPNLVAYYHADNVTGNANVVAGKVGNALSFDGTNDYVKSINTVNTSQSVDFAVSLWFKTNTTNAQAIATATPSSGGGSLYLYISGGILYNFDFDRMTLPANYSNNQWHHVYYYHPAGGVVGSGTFYYDGANQTITAGTGAWRNTLNNFAIGARADGAFFFNGSINQVRLWNRSLSATEISRLYGNESTGFVDPNMNRTGLVGEWNMNESATSLWASTTPDTSGNANNGSEINMVGANITDSSRNANNGNVFGGITLLNAGQYNQSFTFDGVNGYIRPVGDINELANDTNISVFLWVKINKAGVRQDLVDKFGGGAYDGTFRFTVGAVGANKLDLYWVNETGSSVTIAGVNTLNPSAWNFVGFTRYYNGTGYVGNLYLNGVLDKTGYGVPKGTSTINELLGIGAYIGGASPTGVVNGSIDEVMIWNRSLSATEIKQLYSLGRANWVYSNEQQIIANTTAPASMNTFDVPSGQTNIEPIARLIADTTYNFYTSYIKNTGNIIDYYLNSCQNFFRTGSLLCSDNCAISGNNVMSVPNLTLTGTGTITNNGNITGVSNLWGNNGCFLWGNSGSYIGK